MCSISVCVFVSLSSCCRYIVYNLLLNPIADPLNATQRTHIYASTVRQVFRNSEQLYYEQLVDKSVECLCLFPYHLADIITKGLRVTPFNYYIDVLSCLLKSDRSYDTLPNFTAADCTYKLNLI